MNTKMIKNKLISEFRFNRGCKSVVDEVGYSIIYNNIPLYYIADIIALDIDHKMIEIEIKRSKNDLIADFKNKEPKHLAMKEIDLNEITLENHSIPNKFYYCLDNSICTPENIEYIKNINKKYGIISIDDKYDLKIIKKAYSIHKSENKKIENAIINRMANIIAINAHTEWINNRNNEETNA